MIDHQPQIQHIIIQSIVLNNALQFDKILFINHLFNRNLKKKIVSAQETGHH